MWGGSVSKQVFILVHHTGFAEVICVPPHCSKSGVPLVAFGNITLAVSVWHALFLGAVRISCMVVLLVWPTHTLQSRRHCHTTKGDGCSLYGLVWVLQRCCQFLVQGPWQILKLIAHCSSCHGYRSVCSCPWEEMNCWIALTIASVLFHSSTLLSVLRAQSWSPQVSVCLMLKYSLVWH